MSAAENTQTPGSIIARYEVGADSCPIVTGQTITPGTEDEITLLRREFTLAREARNWQLAAQIAYSLTLIYFERNNLYDARERAQDSVAMYRELNDNEKLARTLGTLATIAYYIGDVDQALLNARESVQIAETAKLSILHGYLSCTVGAILCYMGQYKTADEAFSQAHASLARAEDDLGMAWWMFMQAREQTRDRFECQSAVKQLETALPLMGDKIGLPARIEILLALADSYICAGDVAKGTEILKNVEALITQNKRYWYRPELYLVKARLAVAENKLQDAAKFAYQGLGMAGDQGDLRMLATLYRTLASILELDRTRAEDTQDALDRAIQTGRKRARRIDLALALRQAGNYFNHLANRPSVRARSSGFLFEAERMLQEMGIKIPQIPPIPAPSAPAVPAIPPAASPVPPTPPAPPVSPEPTVPPASESNPKP